MAKKLQWKRNEVRTSYGTKQTYYSASDGLGGKRYTIDKRPAVRANKSRKTYWAVRWSPSSNLAVTYNWGVYGSLKDAKAAAEQLRKLSEKEAAAKSPQGIVAKLLADSLKFTRTGPGYNRGIANAREDVLDAWKNRRDPTLRVETLEMRLAVAGEKPDKDGWVKDHLGTRKKYLSDTMMLRIVQDDDGTWRLDKYEHHEGQEPGEYGFAKTLSTHKSLAAAKKAGKEIEKVRAGFKDRIEAGQKLVEKRKKREAKRQAKKKPGWLGKGASPGDWIIIYDAGAYEGYRVNSKGEPLGAYVVGRSESEAILGIKDYAKGSGVPATIFRVGHDNRLTKKDRIRGSGAAGLKAAQASYAEEWEAATRRARSGLPPRTPTETEAARQFAKDWFERTGQVMGQYRHLLERKAATPAPSKADKSPKSSKVRRWVVRTWEDGTRMYRLVDSSDTAAAAVTKVGSKWTWSAAGKQGESKTLKAAKGAVLRALRGGTPEGRKEKAEHPWLTNKQAERVARDHKRKTAAKKKRPASSPAAAGFDNFGHATGKVFAELRQGKEHTVDSVAKQWNLTKSFAADILNDLHLNQYVDRKKGVFSAKSRYRIRTDAERSAAADRLMPFQVQYRKSRGGRWGIWNTGTSSTQAQRDADTLYKTGPHYGVRVYNSQTDSVVYVPGSKPTSKRKTAQRKRLSKGAKKAAKKGCKPATPKRCAKVLGKRGGKASARAAKKCRDARKKRQSLSMDEQIKLARKALK